MRKNRVEFVVADCRYGFFRFKQMAAATDGFLSFLAGRARRRRKILTIRFARTTGFTASAAARFVEFGDFPLNERREAG